MKKKASIFRSLVLLLLVFVTVSSCCISAMAIGFSGDSFVSSSGGSALSKTGFSVRPGGVKNLVIGYRFAGIKKDGNLADDDIHCVDVILSSKYVYVDGAPNGAPPANYRLIPQWSKYEYFKVAWGKNVEGTTPVDFDILSTDNDQGWEVGNIFKEGDLDFVTALPMGDLSNKPTASDTKTYKQLYGSLDLALDAWQDQNDNIDAIARKVGFRDGLNSMVSGDTITIEPIYTIQIASDCMLLTATEAAYMGGMYVYFLTNKKHSFESDGWSYTGANLDDNGAGTWGAIGNFTNLRMCNLLYAPENKGLGWVDVSGPQSDVSGNRDRLTFYEILRGGWGVAICYQKTDEFDLSIDAIKFTSSSGDEVVHFGNQSYVPKLPHGETTTIYYLVSNNSKNGMYADVYWASDKNSSMTARYTRRWLGAGESTWLKIGTRSASEDKQYRYTGWIFENGATSALREANSQNNTMTAKFTVDNPQVDLKAVNIRYEYFNADNNMVTQLVFKDENGNLKLQTSIFNPSDGSWVQTPKITNGTPVFPHNARVFVYAVFENTGECTTFMDGYYSVNGSDDAIIPNKVNGDGNIMATPLRGQFMHPGNPGMQIQGYIGDFIASQYGTGTYIVSVYENGEDNAEHEIIKDDNVLVSDYLVYGDVLVKDIQVVPYSSGLDSTCVWQLEYHAIMAIIKNDTPYPQVVNVYYSLDGGNTICRYTKKTLNADTELKVVLASGITEDEIKPIMVTCWVYAYDLVGIDQNGTPQYVLHTDTQGRPSAAGECDKTGQAKDQNNTYNESYNVKAEVGVVDIIFKDENDIEIPDQSKIKEGTTVRVYYACTNPTPVARNVELYFHGNKIVDSNGNAVTYKIPAKTTESAPKIVYATSFVANRDDEYTTQGKGSVVGEVRRTGTNPDPAWEADPDNNTLTESFGVIFYDVEITDIYYLKAGSSDRIGIGETTTVLEYGARYGVYYHIRNNGSEPVTVHIYNGLDSQNEGVICVTPSKYVSTGITIPPGKAGGFLADILEPYEQELGVKPIEGSVFIVNDDGRTLERTYANNARAEEYVFKHNVSIEEVYLTPLGSTQRFPVNSSDPSFVDIPVGTTANVHYVLKNHTSKTIKVNIYTGSTPKMQTVNHGNYVITLNPMETKEVVLDKTLTLNATGRRMLVGSVYRDGCSPNADPYEMTFSDNTTNCYYNGVVTPYITPIKPNAPYREGTDVITSYYLFNPTNKNYTGRPGATAEVRLTVKLKGTDKVIYEENKFTVIPASCSTVDRAQLVYFKWSVPEDYLKDTDKFEVCADLVIPQYPDIGISYVSYSQDYINKDARFTPDTKYEASEPDGWTKPSSPDVSYSETKEWYTWTYNNGTFTRNRYGIEANGGYTGIMPTSVTAFNQRGQYYMKSGYGVEIGYSTGYYMNYPSTPGGSYSTLLADMYTVPQYAYMIWPEFQYSEEDGCISTLEWVASAPEGDRWKLYEFMDYGRVHWTPIWFPDGDYIAYACYSDLWTPMGMITVCSQSNKIIIDGNMYDDWYIGHG